MAQASENLRLGLSPWLGLAWLGSAWACGMDMINTQIIKYIVYKDWCGPTTQIEYGTVVTQHTCSALTHSSRRAGGKCRNFVQ